MALVFSHTFDLTVSRMREGMAALALCPDRERSFLLGPREGPGRGFRKVITESMREFLTEGVFQELVTNIGRWEPLENGGSRSVAPLDTPSAYLQSSLRLDRVFNAIEHRTITSAF